MGSNCNDFGRNQPTRRDVDDATVEAFIASHPNGGTLDEIAAVLGVTRTRAGQVLKQALVKCQRVAVRRGLEVHDLTPPESLWDRLGV